MIDRDRPSAEVIGKVCVPAAARRHSVLCAAVAGPRGSGRWPAAARARRLTLRPVNRGVQTSIDARTGTISAPVRSVRAGEVVEIAAAGSYRVGGFYDAVLDCPPRRTPVDGAPGQLWTQLGAVGPSAKGRARAMKHLLCLVVFTTSVMACDSKQGPDGEQPRDCVQRQKQFLSEHGFDPKRATLDEFIDLLDRPPEFWSEVPLCQ